MPKTNVQRKHPITTFVAAIVTAACLLASISPVPAAASSISPGFKLGNEVLFERFHHLIENRRVGLITNQSGVNQRGQTTIDALAQDPLVNLTALYGPEHGIDGQAGAGAYVASYTHPTLGIPVFSLYGDNREPSEAMLREVDVLLFDIQDIGARTYTYISTLNYAMKAAKKYGKSVIVLDRPNPLGGITVEGPVLENALETFVGVDNLPMAHGMTVGELARFFNREIGVDLTVIPMEGYTRNTIYQDTGLPWIATSPKIKNLDNVFGYMATGLGEGTGIQQNDFTWIGGKGIDAVRFAELMNGSGIPGVTYVAETINGLGGVRLQVTDHRSFNPVKSGLYALAYARQLCGYTVPKSGTTTVMFDKIQGTARIGQWLEQKLSPQEIESRYAEELNAFKVERQKYLIYGYEVQPGRIAVLVNNTSIFFDSDPYIDENDKTMVPVRAIAEALGATVTWDGNLYAVGIAKDGRSVNLSIGSSVAKVNGIDLPMETAPVIRNDRTMVPVRHVSEFFDAIVDWDEPTRTVIVNQ